VPVAVPGPAAQIVVLQVLLARRPSRAVATTLVGALDRCEGLKGRPALAVAALERVRELDLLDPLDARAAARLHTSLRGTGRRAAR